MKACLHHLRDFEGEFMGADSLRYCRIKLCQVPPELMPLLEQESAAGRRSSPAAAGRGAGQPHPGGNGQRAL